MQDANKGAIGLETSSSDAASNSRQHLLVNVSWTPHHCCMHLCQWHLRLRPPLPGPPQRPLFLQPALPQPATLSATYCRVNANHGDRPLTKSPGLTLLPAHVSQRALSCSMILYQAGCARRYISMCAAAKELAATIARGYAGIGTETDAPAGASNSRWPFGRRHAHPIGSCRSGVSYRMLWVPEKACFQTALSGA